MFLLFNPLFRNILIGIAIAVSITVAYALWVNHEQAIGAAKERAAAQAIALQHEQNVLNDANKIDNSVNQDATVNEDLLKKWSEPQ